MFLRITCARSKYHKFAKFAFLMLTNTLLFDNISYYDVALFFSLQLLGVFRFFKDHLYVVSVS